jgi:SHS2 domain-containing protein
LSHTADVGIEAVAPSLAGLLETLAAGMFSLMVDPLPAPSRECFEIDVESISKEELVVDVLSELLALAETEDLLLSDFRAEVKGETIARVIASGAAASGVELTGAPVKAVTYHDLAVATTGEGWYGRVYFDV